jgi:hypothetical protein
MGLMESVRRTAILAGAVGLLAACGSSGPDGGTGTSRSAVDYTNLAKDPSGDKRGSGYLYAPGAPVAIWI